MDVTDDGAARPRDAPLGEDAGDPYLAERVRAALGEGDGHRGVAAAWVEQGRITTAGSGRTGGRGGTPVRVDTPFETGSVAKALTGMLLAAMADAGEVRLDERVGDLVPGRALATSGDATLEELATHRSGLPRLPGRAGTLFVRGVLALCGRNPYSGGPEEVFRWAARAGARGGGAPEYSNLGAAVLGDALAVRAGTSYPALLRERILDPLGMTSTTVAATPADLPPGRAHGSTAGGRPRSPWLGPGYAPAGVGVWSVAGDLARLASGVLDGTAPGARAADARADLAEGVRIGLGWLVLRVDGVDVTWHNGGTGGFGSFVGIDREAGHAVVLLTRTASSVDAAGFRLLLEARALSRPDP